MVTGGDRRLLTVTCRRLQALLELGARPRGTSRETGETALHVAVAAGDVTLVAALVAAGADANALNARGEAPLTLAVARADVPCTELLISNGACGVAGPEGAAALRAAAAACEAAQPEEAAFLYDKAERLLRAPTSAATTGGTPAFAATGGAPTSAAAGATSAAATPSVPTAPTAFGGARVRYTAIEASHGPDGTAYLFCLQLGLKCGGTVELRTRYSRFRAVALALKVRHARVTWT